VAIRTCKRNKEKEKNMKSMKEKKEITNENRLGSGEDGRRGGERKGERGMGNE
jgi:hypothetical protein